MPFLFVRDEIYLSVCVGELRIQKGETAELRIEVAHASGSIGYCKQTTEFHLENPFVERVLFAIPPDVDSTSFTVVIRDVEEQILAQGIHHVSYDCNEDLDSSEIVHLPLFLPDVKLADDRGQDLEKAYGSLKLMVTLLASNHMNDRSRWKAVHQISLLDQLSQRLNLCSHIRSWHAQCCIGVFKGAEEHTATVPWFDAADISHENDTISDASMDDGYHSCDSDCSIAINLFGVDAQDNRSGLHPLEQHTGGYSVEANAKCSCRAKSEDNYHIRWVPAHPLALQAYESLKVLHGDAWKVPSPQGLVPDSVPPPVKNVTCIYGIDYPTLRTVFLRHRAVMVIGGPAPVSDSMQAAFQLDLDADIDGLVVYDGQGFEVGQVPQVLPDAQKQVFHSGDGTVNYQSLRHAATWKTSCNVQMYELPACDHRGVSQDPRMLRILGEVLGLQPNSRCCFKSMNSKGASQFSNELQQTAEQAGVRWSGFIARCSSMAPCRLIAKSGFSSLNVFRRRFARIIQGMAVLSCIICALVLIFGSSYKYDVVTKFRWGYGGLEANDDLNQDSDYRFELGVLTYAFIGDADSDSIRPRCTKSYADCVDWYKSQDESEATGDKTNLQADTCGAQLKRQMCEDCYSAGEKTYIIAAITCLLQIPLVWVSVGRTSAASDSRCLKAITLPLAIAVIAGSWISYRTWVVECFDQLEEKLTEIIIAYPGGYYRDSFRSIAWACYLPIFAGTLACCVWILSMLTPVPELYQHKCSDPIEIEIRRNSSRND